MKYQFHLTCRACPEQYDVKDGDYTDGYHDPTDEELAERREIVELFKR